MMTVYGVSQASKSLTMCVGRSVIDRAYDTGDRHVVVRSRRAAANTSQKIPRFWTIFLEKGEERSKINQKDVLSQCKIKTQTDSRLQHCNQE